MQKALKKVTNNSAEQVNKTVTLCLRSQPVKLNGIWNWQMESDAVYCSDRMLFPDQFVGTKGIIHPDDLSKLMGALTMMEEKEVPRLDFRIITTYGEVKTISGQRVSIDDESNNVEPIPGKEPWQEVLEHIEAQKENDFLKLRNELIEYTERLNGIGSWLINKQSGQAWYSDNAFRIYGVAPQSLNEHANTFNRFIHKDDRTTVLDAFEKAYKEHVPLHIEYRIVLQNGETRYIQQITRWLFAANGQSLLSGIVRDVTIERMVADELLAMQSQSQMYRQALRITDQQAATGFWLMNLATRKTSYSENYYRIYGFKQSFLPAYNSFLNLVHSDDRAKVNELIDKMYNEHVLPETEFRIIRPDGKQRHLKQSGRLFISPNKELYMIGVVQDISVQKGLEKKITELNENISLNKELVDLMENTLETSSFIWLADGFMQWSDGFYKMLGYRPGSIEPLQRFPYKNIHPADLKTFKDAEAILLNHQNHDDIFIRFISKGGIRKVRISFQQLNDSKGVIIGLVHDVSRQAELNEQFNNNRLFTALLEDSVNDMVVFTNTDNTIIHWNRTAEEQTGVTKEEALYHNLFEIVPSLNQEGFLDQLHLAIRGSEEHSSGVHDLYLKKPHEYRLWPLKNEAGDVIGVLHVIRDISRQLQLQQQLNERLNFIESLVEASVDRIVVLDRFMNYLYWNKKAEQYYGISKERVLGKNILEVFPSFRNHPGYQKFISVLKGETVYLPATADEETDEYFETYVIPIKNDSGEVTAVLWTVHDLSREWLLQKERRKVEAEINRLKNEMSQKAEGQYKLLFDSMDEGYCIIQMMYNNEGKPFDWRFVEVNPAFEKHNGLVNAKDKTIKELAPDIEQKWIDIYAQVAETGVSIRFQQDSETLQRIFDLYAFRIGEAEEKKVAVLFTNITERKRTETALRQSEENYRSLFNSIDEGFCMCELVRNEKEEVIDYRFLDINPAFKKHMQMDPSTVIGRLHNEVLPPDKSEIELYANVVASNKKLRKEFYSKGMDQWFDVNIFPRGGDKFAVLFDNITERKKAEEQLKDFATNLEEEITNRTNELQKQLTLLRYTEYLAQSGSWEYEIEAGDLKWSEGMYKMFGLPKQMKVLPETYLQFAVEEDRPIAKKIISHFKKHNPFEDIIRINRNNEIRTLKIKASVLHDKNGKSQKFIGVDVDVTDVRKAEEKLKESEHWLEQTAKASPDAIMVYDLHNKRPTLLNNCYADWLGICNKDFTEMGTEGRLKLVHPDDRLKLLQFNGMVAEASNGDVLTLEYRVYADDGKMIWIRNRSKVFERDAAGKVTHILSILQNVTEEITLRDELKQRIQFAETLLDNSINRMTVFDRNYRFVVWNKRCEEVLGVTRDKVIGKTIFEMFPGVETNPVLMSAQQRSLQGEYVHIPSVQDGFTGAYLELFYVPLKNEWDETYAVLNIMNDVSSYVRSAEVLDALNKQLESKNIQLEQKNEEITNFAFVASHDMKEPLRKIHTFADLMMEQESSQLSQKGKGLVEKITASVHRMEVLIEDILVLTKIHSDPYREENVDLNEILKKVIDDLDEQIKQTGAIIHASELPVIKANSNQMFYLFKNLMSNAIKFQKPGSVPELTITSEIVKDSNVKKVEPNDEYLKLSFADNGFGFDQRYTKKIFQVFQRLHGATEFSGTGIGLAICKKIMENHNGIITVNSEPGKGSVFTCFFPLH